MLNEKSVQIKALKQVVWQGEPVITTELLASVYEVDVRNIQMNFKNNERRFSAGVHYYKLTGDELKQFILQPKDIGLQISPMTRSLMLWTERGTVRHAKMLGTDQAWNVQEALEDFYFSRKEEAADDKPLALKNIEVVLNASHLLKQMLDQCTVQMPVKAIKAAIDDLTRKTGLELPATQKLLAEAAEQEPYVYDPPSTIAYVIGVSPKKANDLLASRGLQVRNQYDEWELTEKGEAWARAVPYKKQERYAYRILWSAAVADYLRSTM